MTRTRHADWRRVLALVICTCELVVQSRGTGAVLAQTPTFSARIDTVRVDVSVRRGGEAVAGLRAEDFEVFDNGVRQRIDLVGVDETPVNVVLALDMSGSVEGERLRQLRAASDRLMGEFRAGDTGALVTFSDRVSVRARPTSNITWLRALLAQPAAPGDTALIDAAHAAMVLGEGESGRPVVIIFSDGADTASFLTEELVLDTARRTGSVVYAVTTSRSDRTGFLDDLVRLTGGRRLDVSAADGLAQAFGSILAEARQRYLLSYTPTGVPAHGWHELTVRVRTRGVEVRARPGYQAGQ